MYPSRASIRSHAFGTAMVFPAVAIIALWFRAAAGKQEQAPVATGQEAVNADKFPDVVVRRRLVSENPTEALVTASGDRFRGGRGMSRQGSRTQPPPRTGRQRARLSPEKCRRLPVGNLVWSAGSRGPPTLVQGRRDSSWLHATSRTDVLARPPFHPGVVHMAWWLTQSPGRCGASPDGHDFRDASRCLTVVESRYATGSGLQGRASSGSGGGRGAITNRCDELAQ